MKKTLLYTFIIILSASCGGRSGAGAAATVKDEASAPKAYLIPPIPAMISDPVEQAEYLSHHYWDGFDFADTTNINHPDYTEQAFVNYVQVLLNIPAELGDSSIATMFRKARADKEMFHYFAELAEKYLCDPNSPFRDDEYYITVLESILDNPELDEWERIRPAEQLRMAMKNRMGEPAADFRYTLESGATGRLYGLRSNFTLLFINNPGCPACKETQYAIETSPFLTELIDAGELTVLAIYPDEDLGEWHKNAPNIPTGWINSYDRDLSIKNGDLYDLKAIPTLYLLDRDKNVLLKDVMSIPLIEQTIYNSGFAY